MAWSANQRKPALCHRVTGCGGVISGQGHNNITGQFTHMQLAERIHDGTVAFAGKCGQGEHGDADRDVLSELGEAAEGAAHRRGLGRVDH